MPSTAVYFAALPSRIALIAASLMLSGVSKSGSPAPRPMTSRPAAFNSRALLVTAMVGDGWMRPSDSARKPLGSGMERLSRKWREGDNNRSPPGQEKLGQARYSISAGMLKLPCQISLSYPGLVPRREELADQPLVKPAAHHAAQQGTQDR